MHRLFRSLVLCTCLAGCGISLEGQAPIAAPSAAPDDTGLAQKGLASIEGDVEAAIDAPWRIEYLPLADPYDDPRFPDLPIVVSIDDVALQGDPETRQALGNFCQIKIVEAWNNGPPPPPYDTTQLVTTIHALGAYPASGSRLEEIERADKWPDSDVPATNQRLCRKWNGESCTDNIDVSTSAEWNATFSYTPRQLSYWGGSQYGDFRPGDDLHITVEAMVARVGAPCPAPGLADYANTIDYGAPPDHFAPSNTNPNVYVMTVPLVTHLAEGQMPRFDQGWVYGDIHYHGQGTDNEGESGYAFRPTLQAMRAMGLDFVFASDHASASGQTTDIDEIYVDNLHGVLPGWTPDFVYNFILNQLKNQTVEVTSQAEAARDTNLPRFQAMRSLLNDPVTGANAQVLKQRGAPFAPRIFLGGEVDLIPEISTTERNQLSLYYGNHQNYLWGNACTELPSQLQTVLDLTTQVVCDSPYQLAEELEPGRYSVLDIQGLGQRAYARQHMLHLPTDGTRVDAFVPSNTTEYGGGHRHLDTLLHEEYEVAHKGYAFLAHPVSGSFGSDLGRLGPDMVPYSDMQLRTAFESQSMLGLELWNEDTRMVTEKQNLPNNHAEYTTWQGLNPPAYFELHHGLFAWDKMLQWGLRPSQTSNISWLPPGQPRRVFMAGGSDAHGDWNYRRVGSISGNSALVDSAIGKPRNLLNVGLTRTEFVTDATGQNVPTLSQSQVTTALASGEFSITDGPALRIAIDNNNNGVIDTGDTMMGGVTDVPITGNFLSGSFPLLVEWRSSPEFGWVSGVDLYVGVENDGADNTLVYAPENHGIHNADTPQPTPQYHSYLDYASNPHVILKDNYAKDPTGLLHINVPFTQGLVGHSAVRLWADAFPAGAVRIQQDPAPDPVCHLSPLCGKNASSCDEICTQAPPPPPTYHFDGPLRPDRLYVRAFARTGVSPICSQSNAQATDMQLRSLCNPRLAFTNPIWLRNPPPPPPPTSLPIGATCNGTIPCVCNSACVGVGLLKTCQARLPLGSACTTTAQCDDDTWCAVNGRSATCQPRLQPRQLCNGSVPCVVGSSCDLGLCSTRATSSCSRR